MKRKKFSKEFKAKVALEAIKGHLTANEIASEYEVHVTQVNTWKKQLLANAGELFGRGTEKQQAEHEQQTGKLYEEIGRLKVEVDWLKKKDRAFGITTQEKCQMIEPGHPELSITRQCQLLQFTLESSSNHWVHAV